MINFFHTFDPSPVLVSLGFVTIYWYGLFIVLGTVSAIGLSLKLAPYYGIEKDKLIDLALWLIIAGMAGARLYDVLLELPYYLDHPKNIFKIWQGGLAIHGAMIGGLLALWLFSKKEKLNAWLIADILAPALALGQAIGRWGNYFNQELFGRPTSVPWGIPIQPSNLSDSYQAFSFFHPTFLYESLGSLLIFGMLIGLHIRNIKKRGQAGGSAQLPLKTGVITAIYFILYSILRFSLEFIKIDATPAFIGLRVPQIMSLLLIIIAGIAIYRIYRPKDLKIIG